MSAPQAVLRSFLPFSRRSALVVAAALMVAVAGLFFRLRNGSAPDGAFVPRGDSEVVENLPTAPTDPRARRLGLLRRRLNADPKNLELAESVAKLNIEESRNRADPRYLGYAQSALAPWWDQANPPTAVLLLRATIRQSLHDFDGALRDLDQLLVVSPDNAQALLTQSVILTVQGRYVKAQESCERLSSLSFPLVSEVCLATLESLQGQAKHGFARLQRAIENAKNLGPSVVTWALSTLAEIAGRAGDFSAAEQHFRTTLALEPSNTYVLGAYADLLLDLGRPAEVVPLLKSHTQNDGLLLRLAIAEAKVGAPLANEHRNALRERFNASHLRGDTVHRREESRFELTLEKNPRKALQLALANWEVQREPWDLRVLLEAAEEAKDWKAAEPALAEVEKSNFEEPRVAELARRLRGAP